MSRSKLCRIEDEFDKQVSAVFPDRENKQFILGVSGGSDSMVLLYLFQKFGISAKIVHCNYQLRGESSDKDQELVEEMSEFWGFKCISVRFDQPDLAGINFQNWAREKRYLAFRDLKVEEKAEAIALAHHLDDQLETIIQKILRGAGIESWKGMKHWNGELFRPLLNISKNELLEYASEKNIPYRLDSTNKESAYARNFLRNSWFPIMHDFFPGWEKNILKIPERADQFEMMTNMVLEQCMKRPDEIDRNEFVKLPDEIQPTILYKFLKNRNKEIFLTEGALKEVAKLNELQTGKSLQLGDNIFIYRNRDHFLYQSSDEFQQSPEVNRIIEYQDLENQDLLIERLRFSLNKWDQTIRESMLQIDIDSLNWPLMIRPRGKGDRIEPFGLEGKHQTVSDLLTNNKIKSSVKANAKIIETFDNRICAVIFPHPVNGKIGIIAEWARCKKNTNQVLNIQRS